MALPPRVMAFPPRVMAEAVTRSWGGSAAWYGRKGRGKREEIRREDLVLPCS